MANEFGSYGEDHDDLPALATEQPAAPPPRNELGQFVSQNAPPPTPPAAQPHNPYMAAKARQYGIDASTLTPDVLAAVLTAVERQQAATARTAQQQKPQPQPAAPEPPLDWGEDDDGKPITSEEQAKKFYPRAVFNAVKASHRVDKVEAENKKLREDMEQERQERNSRAVLGKFNRIFAGRPDLFGENPADAAPGTPEHDRYERAMKYIGYLTASGQATTLAEDAKAAMLIAEQAVPLQGQQQPRQQQQRRPQQAITANAYRQAELARPSGRQAAEQPKSRRDALIEHYQQQRAEQNGSYVVDGGDDNDDLPDAPKG